jgi:ligand-binding sensor domain-containing protein
MLRLKKILLLSFLFLPFCFSIAQQIENKNAPSQYRTIHWGLDEGLSHDWVSSMIQDVNGFLWIATQFGLNRFDGGHFKKYFADKTKKNKTISGHNINGLVEDSLHNIWIGTNKGISCYDIRADTFRNISSDKPLQSNIPFWATKDEVFCWDFPGPQLVAFNIHSFEKRILARIATADTVGFGVSAQYAIYDVHSNSVWLEKGFGGLPGQGLLQVSLVDGKRSEFTWPCYRKLPHHSHWSEGMRYDRKRYSIWISSPDGLMEFTLSDKKFHHVDAMNQFIKLESFGNWAGIDIDPEGRVWMGTGPKGIIIYDPVDNSVRLPFANDSVQQNNVSDLLLTIYCAKDGIVWLGHFAQKGIYQIAPFSPAVKRYFANDSKVPNLTVWLQIKKLDFSNWQDSTNLGIGNCITGDRGTVWMAAHDGVIIFNPHTGLFDLLRARDLSGLKGHLSDLYPVKVDAISNKAWILGDEFFEMDIASRKCTPIMCRDSNGNLAPLHSLLAPNTENLSMKGYKNGCIISATFPGHQEILTLSANDPVAQKILSFLGESIDFRSVSTNDDNLIFLKRPDSATNLTYMHRDGQWIRTTTPLDSVQWSGIFYNKADQTYWIIAETQLMHYDKNLRIIHTYSDEDGMPGVIIHGLIPDNKGNIWFNTDRSIFHLNPKSGTITSLTEKDGFSPKYFYDFSGAMDANGDIFITGRAFVTGVDKISPDKYVFSPSSVYLESLKINQQTFPVSTGINDIKKLSLKYSENNIVIETGTIDYYSKGNGQIRYRLETEGRKAEWQYVPAYYTIRYEELPPGNYTLQIQASNAANEFAGPIKTLIFQINPPFWDTWSFRIFAFVFLVDSIYTVVRWRLRQRFKLQLERSEKETQMAEMRQRTAELQQQKIEVEMQALRAQMNPHFIFNSLNSINRFILQNDRMQASGYLTKFSKLVRMILHNSQASLIPLESELESLNLYLDLEAVRFDHKFQYKISCQEELDIEVLKVPPLILQPYTENAIWHGLMHREDKGQLDIEVSEENDHLYFKITDNGVGRRKAAELASKSATKHKSMGLRITADRIAGMQSVNGNESPVTINDLTNADGTAAGTEVTIKIPVVYD